MILTHKFSKTNPSEVLFFKRDRSIAIGEYTDESFVLLEDGNGELKSFANAMQAFSYLRSIHEPTRASPKTVAVFETPARAVDNLSKYKGNLALKEITKDVFFAHRS